MKHDSDREYAQLFVPKNGRIAEYAIPDSEPGEKITCFTYEKDSSEPNGMKVYDSHGNKMFNYHNFDFKIVE